MKFSRTAYTDLHAQPLRDILNELVHACYLDDLPFHNCDLNARRNKVCHPDKLRVTITVERVLPAGQKARKGMRL